jgi:glucose/arabinose dehydrogenase
MRKSSPWYFILVLVASSFVYATNADFHNAPESAKAMQNPYEGSPDAATAGKAPYHLRCARCHGERGEGSGNIPPLRAAIIRRVTAGEMFWFITKGDVKREMPSWANISKEERWKIVTYVKAMNSANTPTTAPVSTDASGKLNLPMTKPPFSDFRTESPGTTRKITAADLPAPFATQSAQNSPRTVARPKDAWPIAPAGFKVELYAGGLDNPRLLRTAPNGDIFLAEMDPGGILVFRGLSEGKPELTAVYVIGLNKPYGIAFYPPGPNPQWLYVGNTNEVVRFPYKDGDLKANAKPEHVADLPSARGGHTTRDVEFSLDGKTMFVGVGSRSNIDDPDDSPEEKNRADILAFNPDGSNMRIYASGIRNAGGGMTVNPKTNELWCSVNERDALGDNLVPDYITHVQEGGFYGWPWYLHRRPSGPASCWKASRTER